MFSNLNKKRVNKRYVPKLRFKGFEENWIQSDLQSLEANKYKIENSNLFLDAKAIMKQNYLLWNGEIHKNAPGDSIIFIKDGSNCGTYFYSKNSVKIASTCEYLKFLYSNNFFFHLLSKNQKNIRNSLITGNAIPHIYKKNLLSLHFKFSTNELEREKISKFLNLLDKQISLLENKLKLTEQMKKYYLYKMINIGNKFLFRFNEFKDSSIENSQLASLVKLNKYKQISASELEQLNSKSGNIKLLPSSKDYDWFSDLVDIKDNRVNYGNVITLGRARYANIKKWKGHFISSNNIIIENNNNVVFDYLYHLINKNKKKFYIEKTTYPVFSSEIFKEFDCSIPSNINEQIKISDFLNKIEWIELHIKNKIELTKKRKSFYLNNLFI